MASLAAETDESVPTHNILRPNTTTGSIQGVRRRQDRGDDCVPAAGETPERLRNRSATDQMRISMSLEQSGSRRRVLMKCDFSQNQKQKKKKAAEASPGSASRLGRGRCDRRPMTV